MNLDSFVQRNDITAHSVKDSPTAHCSLANIHQVIIFILFFHIVAWLFQRLFVCYLRPKAYSDVATRKDDRRIFYQFTLPFG